MSLAQFISKHGLLVTPVVGWIPAEFEAVPSPTEVAACFWAPLDVFLSAAGHEAHDFAWGGVQQRMHTFTYDGRRIWGLTASILIHVASIALARPPEFEPHTPGQLSPMVLAAMYTGNMDADATRASGHL